MVGVLHVDAQLLEGEHGLAADVGAGVERGEVEVAALVERLGRAAVLRLGVAEVEVLELGPDVEGVEAHLLRALQRPPQHVARVALVGLAARGEHVAEHPRDALLVRPPGQHLEGGHVGHGDHVRLLDGVEAGDRGAVEAHAALEGVVELRCVDREALQLPQDVGEPEADEADVPLLDLGFDALPGRGLLGHGPEATPSAARASPAPSPSGRARRAEAPAPSRSARTPRGPAARRAPGARRCPRPPAP